MKKLMWGGVVFTFESKLCSTKYDFNISDLLCLNP